ncbi:MAG: beta-ketoacyl synthase chain length factor [Ignavibacteria bacterium]
MPIARWSEWRNVPAGPAAPPVLGFVEPMLRRRLSSLAKISLKVAHECAHDQPSVRFVYASRHGDMTRTAGMLDALATGEPPSPTAFSLSVPNAAAGLFSILRHDDAPATAISAARSSFGFALLEAAMQYAEDPGLPVLLVYADEPVPEVFGVGESEGNALPHAVALLLSRHGATPPMAEIACSMTPAVGCDDHGSHAMAFVESLSDGTAGAWCGEGRRWNWSVQ